MATVMELTTYSRPSIYRLISQGRFPVPLKLGGGKIAFREAEILDWLESRPRAISAPGQP
jgi:prophage regulatory protein